MTECNDCKRCFVNGGDCITPCKSIQCPEIDCPDFIDKNKIENNENNS